MRVGQRRVWRLLLSVGLVAVVCAASAAVLMQRRQAYVAGSYTAGESGFDISWP